MRILLLTLCMILPFQALAAETRTAIFAGGCFWSMHKAFEGVSGITNTVAGYTGGHVPNPSYHDVTAGDTGHREAVLVSYDPNVISYEKLLEVYWQHVDPFDDKGQFCDKGAQYRSAVYYRDDAQKQAAIESKMLIEADSARFGASSVATELLPAAPFYAAEDYHQRYYEKNTLRYNYYSSRCGRDARLSQLWDKNY
jgi:peptide-methionine (S)-S-oxide reductase